MPRYDEVLVGAPLYSPVQNPEAGRVYVYRNIAVSVRLSAEKTDFNLCA